MLLLIILLTAFISTLAGPAADWAGKLPKAMPEVERKLAILHRPINAIHSAFEGILSFTAGGVSPFPESSAARSPNIVGVLLTGTAAIVAGLFTTLVVLFYLLVAGEVFLRRLVEVLPRFADKRQAVEISQHIERNISMYLITVR